MLMYFSFLLFGCISGLPGYFLFLKETGFNFYII